MNSRNPSSLGVGLSRGRYFVVSYYSQCLHFTRLEQKLLLFNSALASFHVIFYFLVYWCIPKQLNAWQAFEPERTESESGLCFLPALWPWASCTAFVSLKFLLFRVRPVLVIAAGTAIANIYCLLLCSHTTMYHPTPMDVLGTKWKNVSKALSTGSGPAQAFSSC